MESGNCSNFRCGICLEYKPVSEGFKDGTCKFNKHPFCTFCICHYVESQIHQNIVHVTCPMCHMELKPESLRTILPAEVIDKWESRICESSIVGSEKTYCPFQDCSVLLVDDGGEVVTSTECPHCHRLFCAQCKVPWHGTMTCAEFQRNIDPQSLDGAFFKLAKEENWQKCPECSMFVQKRNGCEHMTCRYCYLSLIFIHSFLLLKFCCLWVWMQLLLLSWVDIYA